MAHIFSDDRRESLEDCNCSVGSLVQPSTNKLRTAQDGEVSYRIQSSNSNDKQVSAVCCVLCAVCLAVES